ncbi:hypothetical protein VXG46_001311 [Acinetobacter baumannii]|jgi:hypothetical protein|uniref:hypothetical protein n=1 Tax=Acinetobacter TaxID=469 RepID=UPI00044C8C3A|nr:MULTISPECIES: hypothetical protein [Acinetobacter calcoaceticus/baumannii complex]EKT9842964.1 hypothetical protein [Acinetobacter baumannii]EKT9845607.1 hypothetical protein [Acinetobacter baumannii]EKV3804860.1 hypothetical protein [Acinetobacter baumannii]EKW1171317.1 hypothetical protein [Acinetobacter baumannii]ELA6825783.1 hypothetical protein [Acinetobacter baumannii]
MNQIKPKRLVIVFVLFLIFIAGIICLRVNELIDSRDLTVLTTVFLVGSFIAIFFEKISEITLIGNSVKLQQINEKSEQLLEQLQVEHFKLRIESAFAADNLFGGDSVFTCRAKLFEVAKDIKDAELVENEELRNKILPLLKLHTGKHLELVQRYGANLEANPLVSVDDPEEMTKVITDEFVNSAKINGKTSNIEKYKEIINNINLYQNLLNASKWFEN